MSMRVVAISGIVLALGSLLLSLGCVSGTPTVPPPSPSYALAASALNPGQIPTGSSATSTVTVTPANAYLGSVNLSCTITGGSPAPACSFNPSIVQISGASAGTSALTVSTTGSTPGASYAITVTASDANKLGPSNGSQALSLTVVVPSYSLNATALNPGTISAGGTTISTLTLTPTNFYTGNVALSCSSATGGAPPPTCAFSPSTVSITGSGAGTSTLTVATTTSTPGGSYSVVVSAIDTNQLAPSNGSQTLIMTTAAIIQNVVIIFQENRTPDNLFQDQNLISAGAEIQNFGVNSSGATIPLSEIDLGTSGANPANYDLSHAHSAFLDMCDLDSATNTCKMDGADKIPYFCTAGLVNCPPPANAQFMYVNPNDVAPYFQMAETYTFADHMFQTNQGPSFPAHQFILSGSSSPALGSNLLVAENPSGVALAGENTGCTAPVGEYLEEIDPTGVESQSTFPCLEYQTLTDLLDAANLSWRYYAPSLGSLWTAPSAVNHMCVPNPAPPGATACTGPDFTAASPKVVLNQSQTNAQILTDIANNQLPTVSWVIPSGDDSDHARSNTGCGPSWVTSIVNAIGNSPYWANTAIIITWDDWGGWYDHVPPPQIVDDGASWGSGYVYGFRVPLIVISPYARAAYISKATHDFGSILHFVESTFSLPSLNTADARADDLSDIFQYTHSPIGFTPITPPSNDATCKGALKSAADPDDE